MTWVVLSILFAVVGVTSLLIARANRKTASRPGNEEWEVGGYVVAGLMLIGFVVLTTRRKALVQVVGYLILENGIYLFGLTQTESVPFLIELGVLLDIFVGVFIMGIVVFHINREFDSLDSTRLTELSD